MTHLNIIWTALSGNHDINEVQQITMLSTGHIYRKVVLMQRTKNFYGE